LSTLGFLYIVGKVLKIYILKFCIFPFGEQLKVNQHGRVNINFLIEFKKKTKDNQPFNFKKLIDMDRWKT
jgi:hypothetical protein